MNLDKNHFISLETKVWDALVNGDIETEKQLIADDFLGIYETGFSDKDEYLSQLEDGPSIEWYKISNSRIILEGATSAALTYQADFISSINRESKIKETMYVTSIWSLRNGKWVNTLSQDTLACIA